MSEEKKSRSEIRYGSKDKEGSPAEEKAEPKAEAKAEGDAPMDMHSRHKAERKDMRGRHEKEHRDIHGQHRTAMRGMQDRHEAEMDAMNARHDTEAAGGGAVGTPGADADQLPNAGMSAGAQV
jgi:hypothetical protein